MSWSVWTDGSAASGAGPVRGERHPGGWAAVGESSEGEKFVLRGRAQNTTNTRMELTAVFQALRSLDAGETVTIHCDCAAVFGAYERHARGSLGGFGKDGFYWRSLVEQFDRMEKITLRPIRRGGDARHSQAHAVAFAEAKAAEKGYAPDVKVLTRQERKERTRHLRAHLRPETRKMPHRPGHHIHCEPGLCVVVCPVWKEKNPTEAYDLEKWLGKRS